VIVRDLPAGPSHKETAIALGPGGELYANAGAPSNACQQRDRKRRSPGLDPCPQLERSGGVWLYDADLPGQRHRGEARFATGMRNTLALAVEPGSGALYAAIHGRDQLGANWGYSDERNAELPAEEFARVRRGDDFGWPYCYYDGITGQKVLAPEYGGDGVRIGRCEGKTKPSIAFPAHWAPNAIVFYDGEQFPQRYRGGAFIAFHGSWNRAPLPQAGYRVVFAPFRDGAPTGGYETFVTGSDGPTSIRPTGLALGPDGSLYVSDDRAETIWRVSWRAAGSPRGPNADEVD
jgi:glucose/arabinose dehydrogenase